VSASAADRAAVVGWSGPLQTGGRIPSDGDDVRRLAGHGWSSEGADAKRCSKPCRRVDRDYDPATDFWRTLRKGLIELHETGRMTPAELGAWLATQTNGRRLPRYREAVEGYTPGLWRRAHAQESQCSGFGR
jgi:hypothetical protein